MICKSELMKAGCSEEFAKKALEFASICGADVEAFIRSVEQMLRVTRGAMAWELEPLRRIPSGLGMDRGFLRAQREYHGVGGEA